MVLYAFTCNNGRQHSWRNFKTCYRVINLVNYFDDLIDLFYHFKSDHFDDDDHFDLWSCHWLSVPHLAQCLRSKADRAGFPWVPAQGCRKGWFYMIDSISALWSMLTIFFSQKVVEFPLFQAMLLLILVFWCIYLLVSFFENARSGF